MYIYNHIIIISVSLIHVTNARWMKMKWWTPKRISFPVRHAYPCITLFFSERRACVHCSCVCACCGGYIYTVRVHAAVCGLISYDPIITELKLQLSGSVYLIIGGLKGAAVTDTSCWMRRLTSTASSLNRSFWSEMVCLTYLSYITLVIKQKRRGEGNKEKINEIVCVCITYKRMREREGKEG